MDDRYEIMVSGPGKNSNNGEIKPKVVANVEPKISLFRNQLDCMISKSDYNQ